MLEIITRLILDLVTRITDIVCLELSTAVLQLNYSGEKIATSEMETCVGDYVAGALII